LIEPDKDQPRKLFEVLSMRALIESITKHGIISPLIIEKKPTGRGYMLIDGERRLRAAGEIGLQEVPCIVTEPQNDIARLIQQFHIQEQHEGWTAIEKANSIERLARELRLTPRAVAQLLNLPPRTIETYTAFAKLLEKKLFEKEEIAINYAPSILTLRTLVKNQYIKQLDEEFSQEQEKELEKTIIHHIKRGTITKRQDIIHLGDSVRTNPRSIEQWMEKKDITPTQLFINTKAQAPYYMRNIHITCGYLTSYIRKGLPLGVGLLLREDTSVRNQIIEASEQLKKLIQTF